VSVICVRVSWDGQAMPLRIADKFYSVNIVPEPDFPFGRKGLWLTRAWQQLNENPKTYGQKLAAADGMLILDGDVAIDPWDLEVMQNAIREDRESVHVAPAKIWPISTRASDWVWAHGLDRFTQSEPYNDDDCNLFTFCFTYLPRALIQQCVQAGMENWVYPDVDTQVCIVAMKGRFRVNLVRACQPKHLNY
jgi:hypothetical protein